VKAWIWLSSLVWRGLHCFWRAWRWACTGAAAVATSRRLDTTGRTTSCIRCLRQLACSRRLGTRLLTAPFFFFWVPGPRRPRAVLSPQQSAPEEKQQQQQLTLTLDAAHAVSEATPSATSVSHPAATLSADEEEETEVEATLEHVVSAACAAAINCRSIIPTR
jgi:hypothetical protein